MRPPSHNDFKVHVPGIGDFMFGRRTYGDRIAIRAEYLRLIRPHLPARVEPTDDDIDADLDADLAAMCAIVAAHRVLCVSAPAGWEDLGQLDLLQTGAEEGVMNLYARLRAAEDMFRFGHGGRGQAAGPGDGAHGGAVVPAHVPAAAA